MLAITKGPYHVSDFLKQDHKMNKHPKYSEHFVISLLQVFFTARWNLTSLHKFLNFILQHASPP